MRFAIYNLGRFFNRATVNNYSQEYIQKKEHQTRRRLKAPTPRPFRRALDRCSINILQFCHKNNSQKSSITNNHFLTGFQDLSAEGGLMRICTDLFCRTIERNRLASLDFTRFYTATFFAVLYVPIFVVNAAGNTGGAG